MADLGMVTGASYDPEERDMITPSPEPIDPVNFDLSHKLGRGPSDTNIKCVGGTVKVHREVMANASAFLKEVFETTTKNTVVVKYFTVHGMWVATNFIYFGQAPRKEDLANPALDFQEACKIAYYCGLSEEIFRNIWTIYTGQYLDESTCVTMWTLANEFNKPESTARPMAFLRERLIGWVHVVDSLMLTKSQMHEFIVGCVATNVVTEYTACFLLMWVNAAPAKRLTYCFELFKLIDLTDMSPAKFVEVASRIKFLVSMYDDVGVPMLPSFLETFGDVAFRLPALQFTVKMNK